VGTILKWVIAVELLAIGAVMVVRGPDALFAGIQQATDSDGDGIPNRFDACPAVPGSEDVRPDKTGCPSLVQAIELKFPPEEFVRVVQLRAPFRFRYDPTDFTRSKYGAVAVDTDEGPQKEWLSAVSSLRGESSYVYLYQRCNGGDSPHKKAIEAEMRSNLFVYVFKGVWRGVGFEPSYAVRLVDTTNLDAESYPHIPTFTCAVTALLPSKGFEEQGGMRLFDKATRLPNGGRRGVLDLNVE